MFDVIKIKNLLKVFWDIVWPWIGLPLLAAIIGWELVDPLKNSLKGPETYYVYVVGDYNYDQNHKKLMDGFLQQANTNLEIDHIKITFKGWPATEKEADIVAANLAGKNDTLMVVGHLSSTASKVALPHYLTADPPIPVILAAETNPQLLPPDYDFTYYPVFRLSPTDDEQAKKAAEFAVDHGARAIWVVEDTMTNGVYSNYLAQEFVNEIHRKLKPSKVLLWTTNREFPSADAVKALGINWVFFAGSWSNGLILTRQIKEIWKHQNMPILLSNSCANLELLQEGGDDMIGVYLIHPMLAGIFNSEGFAHWGKLAYQLIIQLVQRANEHFEGLASEKGGLWYEARRYMDIHRVADARNALRVLMEKAAGSNNIDFQLNNQSYQFKRDGNGRLPLFHGKIKFHDF